MIERMAIVTWYTPEEKLPPEGETVVVTISGKLPEADLTFDHIFGLAKWHEDSGWSPGGIGFDDFRIHAWADLEPYDVPSH